MTALLKKLLISEIATSSTLVRANKPHAYGQLGTYRVTAQYTNPTAATLSSLFARTRFHGTTSERLGNQHLQGQFANQGRKIYFADLRTATGYAVSRAASDGSSPVVVQISSEQAPQMNDLASNDGTSYSVGGVGAYSYFRTDVAPVQIVAVSQVEEVTSLDKA